MYIHAQNNLVALPVLLCLLLLVLFWSGLLPGVPCNVLLSVFYGYDDRWPVQLLSLLLCFHVVLLSYYGSLNGLYGSSCCSVFYAF